MSRSQKMVIVVLALLVLVFALIMVRGATQPGHCGGPRLCAQSYQPSGLTTTFGAWLAPLAPKVDLAQDRFSASSGNSVTLDVPPADKAFRMLRLRLAQGAAARVVYVDFASAQDSPLREQKLDLVAAEDKLEGTLTATRQGGTATLQCVGNCAVEVP